MEAPLPTNFTVDVTDEGGIFRLRCAGELDMAAAPLVQDALQAMIQHEPREVVLDWTALTFMDSSGIRVLFQTLALCRNKNIDLTWALGDSARKTLDRVGIHDALLRDYSAGTGAARPTTDEGEPPCGSLARTKVGPTAPRTARQARALSENQRLRYAEGRMSIEIKYALVGEQHVAYTVVGDGPLNLVLAPPVVSNIEILWENPLFQHFVERLGSFATVAMFDKRGTGLSDPIIGTGVPTLEQRMDDILAVMDAVGWQKATLLGHAEGGPLCTLFAATYPDRTSSLILINGAARLLKADDYPWGWGQTTPMHEAARLWGIPNPDFMERFAPGMHERPGWEGFVWREARERRFGASPGMFVALQRVAMEIDVRDILPAVRCPTLVMHRKDNVIVDVGNGRYLADNIPESKYIELPGADHYPWYDDAETVLDHIEEFMTGHLPTPVLDRILATILFTDIVGSTARAASIGDHAWKGLLNQHHAIVRRELDHFRGREVDTAGDGFFATFDGPARGVKCAMAIRDNIRTIGLEIRAGLHTGECEIAGSNVGGLAVHIGARVASKAGASEVLVSSTVKDLVAGSGIAFEDRGLQEFKGVPDWWHIFAVADS